jgi:hypothetical protein
LDCPFYILVEYYMNERIKELVKQAGGHISMRNLASNPVQHIESVELWDDRIEKFAEMLVKDIMENLSFHGHEDAVSQVQWHAANKYGVKV